MTDLDKIEDYATYRVDFSKKFGSSVKYMGFEEFSVLWSQEFDGEETYFVTMQKETRQEKFI